MAVHLKLEVAGAKDYPGTNFDLVAFFDCLHDMGDPVGAARPFRGPELRPPISGRLAFGYERRRCLHRDRGRPRPQQRRAGIDAIVGVGGVLAFSVSGRTREFGIRMALGAPPRNILTIVLVEGVAMAGIGVGTGVVVGFALDRLIAKYTTDIHQPGALAFVASAVVILGAAVIASAVPAARAARVNAVEALRSE